MLSAEDFPAFFEWIHGRSCFPWQARLAREVLGPDGWPGTLALPTGVGKTSAIDVALFALAVDPARAPRRIVLVVDRRVVVDQANIHARRIRERMLASNADPVVREVASRLLALTGGTVGEPPFAVAVLRGGMPRDDDWARRPDQPLVALSTVDQVGSRLLFRGYGVSERMAPVHAGLLGNDTLFLLDEVHLAVPFAETLRAIQSRWRGRTVLPARWGVVEMSATPTGAAQNPEGEFNRPLFLLDAKDDDHPVLTKRRSASKLARLELVKVKGEEPARAATFADRLATAATEILAGGARSVLVVVNRVDGARAVHARLALEVDAVLLTGRMRPFDREEVLSEALLARISAGRARQPEDAPLVVVATQCVEAGADFDFDGLVTECASLDALRQRFGRLDRLGDLGESRAAILARADTIAEDDPIYGPALGATWAWLRAHPETHGARDSVDFGLDRLRLPADLSAVCSPVLHAPILLPAHLDAWAQTSPPPSPDPDPALWLHGPRRGAPEVQVVWRADIDNAALATMPSAVDRQRLIDRVEACPPGSLEAMTLPLHAVRRWLEQVPVPGVSDAPARIDDEPRAARGRLDARRWALAWRGDDSEVVEPKQIRPGDTLVVPAAWGGIRHGNWDPTAVEEPVSDRGDRTQLRLRGRATLRLHPDSLRSALGAGIPDPPRADPEAEEDPIEAVDAWLDEVKPRLGEFGGLARRRRAYRLVTLEDGGYVLVARRRERAGAEVSTADDGASFTDREVSLSRHLEDVRDMADSFVRTVGLPADVADDIRLAAWLHDVGKADERFQRLLVGGSDVRAAGLAEPLAKSAFSARDAAARRKARIRSGYPDGYRHEVLSVAMVEALPEALAKAHDSELVLHLVGSHHGWCRPFAPAVLDRATVEACFEHDGMALRAATDHTLARIDSGISDRYWSLTERYGWWGLAWLEAILRLADHRASEREQQAEGA